MRLRNAPLEGKVLCWYCNRPLVGKGGSWKARPLYFAYVLIEMEEAVKVHKCCEKDAKESVRRLTANFSGESDDERQFDADFGHAMGLDS